MALAFNNGLIAASHFVGGVAALKRGDWKAVDDEAGKTGDAISEIGEHS
ncbi:MAG: hypothetical protein M3Y24_04690 [Acidobacteriota bacterium]|nr:hypothetical protein [Acidobacteriota bacterium]MDQ2776579.1 hypothetical protein [Acidobacteriota bacterium]